MLRGFPHFSSEAAHSQAEAQSCKKFLAVWNRPKVVLQNLGKAASCLQALDIEFKVPRTFAQFRSEAAHAQPASQSAKRFLAVWNRPNLVLQSLGKPAGRLQASGGECKVPQSFVHFRMSRFIMKFWGDFADQPE